MRDRTQYYVTHSEPGAFIPTLGAAATALDQYRTVGIAENNLPDLGAAFTDVEAVSAISKIAEGGVSSIDDLLNAENALQALLLHDIVHVIIPAAKLVMAQGHASYLRTDDGLRSQFGFELFSLAESRDFLIAPEVLHTRGGHIAQSSDPKSPFLGKKAGAIGSRKVRYWSDQVEVAMNTAIMQHGIPAYLSNPRLQISHRGDGGFTKKFYAKIRPQWDEATKSQNFITCSVGLPPLLAIVLHRLTNRQDLKAVLDALRQELAPVRAELRDFNGLVQTTSDWTRLERKIAAITESFEAIIPEVRMNSVERRHRRLLTIQDLSRPVLNFMSLLAVMAGTDLTALFQIVGGQRQKLYHQRSVIDRTVTAQTFVELFRTDGVQSLISMHLTPAEIDAVERSTWPQMAGR